MIQPAVQALPQPEQVRRTLGARTAAVEEHVRAAFEATLAPHSSSESNVSGDGSLAVVAVGGFGRGELFPCSDIDLLLLVATDADTPPREAISGFLQRLWDAGLRPSHSVHSVADCTVEHEDNTEFTISLLDHRLMFGSEAVYADMARRFRQFCSRRGTAIANKLVALAEKRRASFQNTIYHLEPNIKEAPGGFRDLQTTRWLHALDPHGSPPDLDAALDFLSAIRLRLHEIAGRDQNVLSFEAQDLLCEDPAALMRDYYRQARIVTRTTRWTMEKSSLRSGTLFSRFQNLRRQPATADFTASRDRVLLRGHRPPRDLSVFEFTARYQLRLAPDTIERLEGFVPEAKWSEWHHFLSLPKPYAGLRAMQEASIVTAALPEWKGIECLVIRDFYHRYTVDEHTLVAVRALETIEDPRFQELWEGIKNPALVRFALLMHDTGRGAGSDIVAGSLAITASALDRLEAPQADREIVEFLVRHHLYLSEVMLSRDLHDGELSRSLADTLGTLERLKMLTLLTYADISAVNPEAMTPWRLEQLWTVYSSAAAQLKRELGTRRLHQVEGMSRELTAFLEGLPARYLSIHSYEEVEAHFALSRLLDTSSLGIEVQHERGVYKLLLVTRDRPALFSSVAGVISSFGLNIVMAEAFSNAAGIVLDSFTFSDPNRNLELNPSEIERLRGLIRRVVEGRQTAASLLRGRRAASLSARMQFRPSVEFTNDASASSTLVEIVAEDRPGLLHDLGEVFSQAGCNIDVVMIDTQAHKAQDVFYVTHRGEKLPEAMIAELKLLLLAACVGSR